MTNRRTILIDLTSLPTEGGRRGMGRYLRELSIGLVRTAAAHESSHRLLALTHLTTRGAFSTSDDLLAIANTPNDLGAPPLDHYEWAYARRFHLSRVARKLDVDVVFLPDPHATPILRSIARARWIITCHDLIPLRFPERYLGWRDGGPRVGRAIERRRYRSADRVIAISDSSRDDLVTHCDLDRDRIPRIYNATDLDAWRTNSSGSAIEARAKFGLGDAPYALYVGAADWHKDIEAILRSVIAARAKGLPLLLAWAGMTEAKLPADVRAFIERHGLRDVVRLLGFVPENDLAVLYRAAVAHLLLSRFEGFGYTVVEAMASGCPAITSGEGSIAEVGGPAAIVASADRPDDVATALLRLANDPDFRAKSIASGLEWSAQFSRERQGEALWKVFEEEAALAKPSR